MRFTGLAHRPVAGAIAAEGAGVDRAIVMLQRLGDPIRTGRRAERAAGAGHQDQIDVGTVQADGERGVDLAEAAGGDSEAVVVGGEAAEGDWGEFGGTGARKQGVGFFGESGENEEVGHCASLIPSPFVSSEVETR